MASIFGRRQKPTPTKADNRVSNVNPKGVDALMTGIIEDIETIDTTDNMKLVSKESLTDMKDMSTTHLRTKGLTRSVPQPKNWLDIYHALCQMQGSFLMQ